LIFLSERLAEKVTRGAAIITVKRWVPDVEPMNTRIREFARQLLNRLRTTATHETEDSEANTEPVVKACSSYLPETIALPAEKPQILQHVELLFALSVKVPDFLDE
jgi:symplekin